MKGKFLKYLTLILIACVCSISALASDVSIKAKLDSVNLLMGKITTLHLEVVKDKDKAGGFPIFSDTSKGYVGVCGDSVELRTSFKSDTLQLGSGKIQINYSIPVQAFDSGYYHLPEFVYVSEGDTARSNRLALKVIPVSVGENDPIADYRNVEEPDDKSIFDNVPDWIINYWWIILLIIILCAVFVYAWKRYKKEGTILPKKPEPTPYEAAIASLRKLKARKLWENGLEKEYFTELTEILRIYLYRRFGINAMEMTSRQIMETLTDNPEIKGKRDYIRQILSIADFVKFAKVRPLPDDSITAFENAMKFVEETKPVETDVNGNSVSEKDQSVSPVKQLKANKSEEEGGQHDA